MAGLCREEGKGMAVERGIVGGGGEKRREREQVALEARKKLSSRPAQAASVIREQRDLAEAGRAGCSRPRRRNADDLDGERYRKYNIPQRDGNNSTSLQRDWCLIDAPQHKPQLHTKVGPVPV